MDFLAEVGLLFGRASSIVSPNAAEKAAVAGSSELADGKRGVVRDEEPTAQHYERGGEFLLQQFRRLEQDSPCPVEAASVS